MSNDNEVINALLNSYNSSTNKTVGGIAGQIGLMSALSIFTFLAFSVLRPREKKVYAPKLKYHMRKSASPDDPEYEPPPPPVSNGLLAWLSPVIHVKEEQLIANIGLDAGTFLRFLRMLRNIFSVLSVLGLGLLIMFVVVGYQSKVKGKGKTWNVLDVITIASLSSKGTARGYMWAALAVSYVINFVVMFFIWRNWQAIVQLRHSWFRSPAYQTKIYSRTLMLTQVPKQYRSDDGLVHLLGQLKVDGIKIQHEIDCATIGRRLGDFPQLIEEHNDAVKDLEKVLVKYLRKGKIAPRRPMLRKGATMGFGGQKHDAIDYLAKQIKFLRDKIDQQRGVIDSLIRKERKARKNQLPQQRIEGENYGFVTLKTIAEAHRIARVHRGKLRELGGTRIQLAPMPHDIVWENISKDSAEIASARTFGFMLIGAICFLFTIPVLFVAILANLSAFAFWGWIGSWQWASPWSFAIVTGPLPPILSATFGFFLPYVIRRISKKQGAPTRSRLERAVIARYFFFMIASTLVAFTLMGTFINLIGGLVAQIGERKPVGEILATLGQLPSSIQEAYVKLSSYWLSWLPLRGFLVFFELIQLVKLALVSLRRVMFSYTPRDIRDMTKPPNFEYGIVVVNLLFIAAVGLLYAPLSPLVTIGACIVFWFSGVVYKYQLLYVYQSRAESGGRMWNVYINRLLFSCVLMQLLMVPTAGLIRWNWFDAIAAAPPIVIILLFKIFLRNTAEQRFQHYRPTPEEAEAQRQAALSEKRTKHSEMERRFLHPSLLPHRLYQIMVHKSQEALAREVLAPYPWFAGKHQHDGVEIKAIREENLEYDPSRDGPAADAGGDKWETGSIASTAMLNKLSPDYTGASAMSHSASTVAPSLVYGRSTDELLMHPRMHPGPGPGPPGSLAPPKRYPGGRMSDDGERPLLPPGNSLPYPPSSFGQPPPFMGMGGNDSSTSLDGSAPPMRQHTSVEYMYDDPYGRRGSSPGGGGGGYDYDAIVPRASPQQRGGPHGGGADYFGARR